MTLIPSDWQGRKVWLAPHIACPKCGHRSYGVQSSSGTVLMVCQSRRCDRTRWRAIALSPGSVGGTLAGLCEGDYNQARALLGYLFPNTLAMGDEAWGYEIVPRFSTEPMYLQVEMSKREAAQDDGSIGRKILKLLAAAL